MQSSITLPQLAAGSVDATVVRWLKTPGESFSAGDVLVELEVENALVQLEASQAGTLQRIVAQPRQTVQVGGELAATATLQASAAPAASAAKPEPAPVAPKHRRLRHLLGGTLQT